MENKSPLKVKQYDALQNHQTKSTFTYIEVVKTDEPDEAVLEVAYDRESQTVKVRSMDPNYELEVHVKLLPEPTLVIYDLDHSSDIALFHKPLKDL